MVSQDHDRSDDPTGFEVDRHVDEQPPREDLIDPEDIEVSERDPAEEADDADPRAGDAEKLPETDALPESQGADMMSAEHLAEDYAERPSLSDEPPRLDDEEE